MNNELTIQLDDNLIHAAEIYARGKNVSLSKMIESYLKLITSEESNKSDYVRYLEVTAGSQARQEDVDALADDVSTNWWNNNKRRFIKCE